MEDKVERLLEEKSQNIKEEWKENIRVEMEGCNLSPIESLFYITWKSRKISEYDELPLSYHENWKYPLLYPQRDVLIEDKKYYRVDFLILMKDLRNWDEPEIKENILIVELDSYLWHGSNPEQFTKEKERERELKKEGYNVIRFSGREIWRNVEKCVDETIQYINNAWGKNK